MWGIPFIANIRWSSLNGNLSDPIPWPWVLWVCEYEASKGTSTLRLYARLPKLMHHAYCMIWGCRAYFPVQIWQCRHFHLAILISSQVTKRSFAHFLIERSLDQRRWSCNEIWYSHTRERLSISSTGLMVSAKYTSCWQNFVSDFQFQS